MPGQLEHSDIFNQYSTEGVPDTCYAGFRLFRNPTKKPKRTLQYDLLATAVQSGDLSLDHLQTFLAEFMESQDGIVRRRISKEDYEAREDYDPEQPIFAKTIYVSDETNAEPLEKRIAPTHFIHNVTNLLFRSSDIARAVEYVLGYYQTQYDSINSDIFRGFQGMVKAALFKLIQDMKALEADTSTWNKTKKLNKLEEDFNTAIMTVLAEAGLAQGLERAEDPNKACADLLLTYRYLGSSLKDASAVKTTSANRSFEFLVDPVRKKTVDQKNEIDRRIANLKTQRPRDPRTLLLAAFGKRLKEDDCQIYSQLRFLLPEGARQAYFEETATRGADVTAISRERVFRAGSTACVTTTDDAVGAAQRQLKQIKDFAKEKNHQLHPYQAVVEPKIAHVSLLAETMFSDARNKEKLACSIMREAAQKAGIDKFNLWPVGPGPTAQGFVGINRMDNASGIVKLDYKSQYWHWQRIQEAAERLLHKSDDVDFIVYGCASNENRATLVAIMAAALQLIRDNVVAADGKVKTPEALVKKAVDAVVATGHFTFTSMLFCPGSRGIKSESKRGGLFSSLANKFLFGGASHTRTLVRLPKKKAPGLDSLISFRYTTRTNGEKVVTAQPKLVEYCLNLLTEYKRSRSNSSKLKAEIKLDNRQEKSLNEIIDNAISEIEANINDRNKITHIIKRIKEANQQFTNTLWFSSLFDRGGKLSEVLEQIDYLLGCHLQKVAYIARYCTAGQGSSVAGTSRTGSIGSAGSSSTAATIASLAGNLAVLPSSAPGVGEQSDDGVDVGDGASAVNQDDSAAPSCEASPRKAVAAKLWPHRP